MADNSNDQLREAKDLLEQLNRLKRQLGEQPLKLGEAQLLEIVQDLPNDIRRARKELEDMEGTASNLYDRLRGVTSEFKSQATTLGKVRGAFRQLEDAAQNLKYDEQGISDLNSSQLKKLQEKISKNEEILGQEARKLISESDYGKVLQTSVVQMTQQNKSQAEINDYITTYLSSSQKLGTEQKALLALYFDQKSTISELNDMVQKRIELEKKINGLLGVGGAAIGGLSAIMGKLGMNSGIFRDAVEEANEKMRETAKSIASGAQSGGKLTVLMAGLGPLAKGFGKALLDPATIILKIVDAFFDVNKAAVEYQRLSGVNATSMAGMNSRLATSVDFLETAAELTKQTGMSATNIFSPEDIAAMAEAKNLLGLSATQAGNLGRYSKSTGVSIDKYKEGIVSATNKYNGANKAAVSHGLIIQDVLNTSEDIALSLGGDSKRIATAATAARSLGLELSKVDQIAGSLLQFEDSIGKELEAELLTGKNLNLEKAREYALSGDLAGLSEELKKNGATAAEFAAMNRIEQEALAGALGMSRQELGKTVMAQEDAKNLTVEQRAAAMGVSVAQLEQMNVQDRITKSLDKLAQAFAPILEGIVPLVEAFSAIVTPIAHIIGMMVGNPIGKWILVALVASKLLIGSIGGIGKAFGGMYSMGKQAFMGIAGLFKKGGLSNLSEKLKGGFKQGATGMGASSPWSPSIAPTPPAGPQNQAGGTGFKDKMKDLAEGLKAMGAGGVLKGIGNLTLAGPALLVGVAAIPFIHYMAKASLESLQPNFEALGEGLTAMSGTMMGSLALGVFGVAALPAVAGIPFLFLMGRFSLPNLAPNLTGLATGLTAMSGTFMGSLALGAFAVAGALAIPSLVFLGGIALIGIAAMVGLEALGLGLTALGAAAATGLPFVAVGLIAALGVSMIPFAYAANLAADGFVKLIQAVNGDNIGPMLLLGPALLGIAAGLGAIALAGVMAIPAIGAMAALSVIAPSITGSTESSKGSKEKSLGEAQKGGTEDSTTVLAAKMDTLIAAVKAGGNVYMDSNKIGKAQVLGSYKSA